MLPRRPRRGPSARLLVDQRLISPALHSRERGNDLAESRLRSAGRLVAGGMTSDTNFRSGRDDLMSEFALRRRLAKVGGDGRPQGGVLVVYLLLLLLCGVRSTSDTSR